MSIPFSELSIVIPCFNEEATIGEVLDRLVRHCAGAELLVVNDGSSDGTAAEAARRPSARLLRHEQNRGYGAAIRSGCRAATRPYVLWFDADGQHAAEMIDLLLAKMPGHDCVIGCRTGKSTAPPVRRAGVAAIAWLARLLMMRWVPDLNCGLRVFRRERFLPYLDLLPEGFSASATTTIVMLESGHRVAWTDIDRLPRAGNRRLRLVRDGLGTLLLIVRLVILLKPWKVFGPLTAALGLLAAVAYSGGHSWLAGGLILCGVIAVLGGIAFRRSWRRRQRLNP